MAGVSGERGFVHQPVHAETGHAAQIDLIETMRFTPEEGMALLEFHLERLKISAAALGFSFDRHAARNAIHALGFELETPSRIRLTLSRSGATTVEAAPLPAPLDADNPVSCILLPLPVDPSDWRLAHKTSDRWFYNAGLKAARERRPGGDFCPRRQSCNRRLLHQPVCRARWRSADPAHHTWPAGRRAAPLADRGGQGARGRSHPR
jgi:hypothetical protein